MTQVSFIVDGKFSLISRIRIVVFNHLEIDFKMIQSFFQVGHRLKSVLILGDKLNIGNFYLSKHLPLCLKKLKSIVFVYNLDVSTSPEHSLSVLLY